MSVVFDPLYPISMYRRKALFHPVNNKCARSRSQFPILNMLQEAATPLDKKTGHLLSSNTTV